MIVRWIQLLIPTIMLICTCNGYADIVEIRFSSDTLTVVLPQVEILLSKVMPSELKDTHTAGGVLDAAASDRKPKDVFWVGKFEVTQNQYFSLIHEYPSPEKVGRKPVSNVTWADAMLFCRILTARMKSNPSFPESYVFRLPTNAEWEFVSGVEGKPFDSNGKVINNLSDYAWYIDNSMEVSHIVGTKKSTFFGLFDLFGNVSEFTLDSGSDCKGLRGGNFWDSKEFCTPKAINGSQFFWRDPGMGFRLVLAKPPKHLFARSKTVAYEDISKDIYPKICNKANSELEYMGAPIGVIPENLPFEILEFEKDIHAKQNNNVDDYDKSGYTALHWAARIGRVDLIKQLVDTGANPNLFSKRVTGGTYYTITPIQAAVASGNAKAVKALLAAGANPGLYHGEKPIIESVKHGLAATFKELYSHFLSVENQTHVFLTDIMYEAITHDRDGDILYTIFDSVGETQVVREATERLLRKSVMDRNIIAVRWLINEGTSLQSQDENGERVLDISVKHGASEVVMALLEKDASLENTELFSNEKQMKSGEDGKTLQYYDDNMPLIWILKENNYIVADKIMNRRVSMTHQTDFITHGVYGMIVLGQPIRNDDVLHKIACLSEKCSVTDKSHCLCPVAYVPELLLYYGESIKEKIKMESSKILLSANRKRLYYYIRIREQLN